MQSKWSFTCFEKLKRKKEEDATQRPEMNECEYIVGVLTTAWTRYDSQEAKTKYCIISGIKNDVGS